MLILCGVAGEDDGCIWRSCKANEGKACYRQLNWIGTAWESYVERTCPEGTFFNKLICQDPSNNTKVCVHEEQAMELISDGDSSGSNYSCGGTWTSYKSNCYKRLGNSNTKSYYDCKKACRTWNAIIVEPKLKEDFYFSRSLGASTSYYWVGLKLNTAKNGWNWQSDQSSLADSDDASENLFGSDSDIATEVAGLSSQPGKCVLLTADPKLHSDVRCGRLYNCLCQRAAWLEQ